MLERKGEEERVFRDLYPKLRRFAAVVGPLEDDPDDLVQEALVRTLARRRLADLENPERFLQTVVLRLASNRRRSLGYRNRLLRRLRGPVAAADAFPSDLSDLFRLTPDVRAVLFLVKVEGWSFRDAAALTGCTEEAARARASRGLRQLRTQLAEELP